MKVTAETELSHQTVFSFKKFSSPKEVNITANTAAIAFFFLFLLTLSIFPFLVLF